jgi:hypothetical protein
MKKHRTPSEAIAAGALVYYPEAPCPRGHTAEYSVKSRSCAQCKRDDRKAWRAANPDANREANLAYYRKNPARYKSEREAYRLRTRYGLTPDAIAAMKDAQGNKCAICAEEFSATPQIDHCNTTGKVRALLCRPCNTGLGGARDRVTVLQAMIKYLRKHRA